MSTNLQDHLYTQTSSDTKVVEVVNHDYDANHVLSISKAHRRVALDVSTNPDALVDIQTNTHIIGTLNVTNDLTVADINVVNAIAMKYANLTEATASGSQAV